MSLVAASRFGERACPRLLQYYSRRYARRLRLSPRNTRPMSHTRRIGTLKMAAPDQETVQKAYDHLDFSRGTEAFLTGMRNQGIGITEELMDARSLFLTPNSTTVYVYMCLDLRDGPMVVQVPPNVLGPADAAYLAPVCPSGLYRQHSDRRLFRPKTSNQHRFGMLVHTLFLCFQRSLPKEKYMRDRAVTEFQPFRHP